MQLRHYVHTIPARTLLLQIWLLLHGSRPSVQQPSIYLQRGHRLQPAGTLILAHYHLCCRCSMRYWSSKHIMSVIISIMRFIGDEGQSYYYYLST